MTKKSSEQQRIITSNLNRVGLKTADYDYLLKQVGDLIDGVPLRVDVIAAGQRVYRGVRHLDKPRQTKLLTHPPAEMVIDFQRCNRPGNPMFYASADAPTVLAELNAKSGDVVYLSTWTVEREFLFFRIPLLTSNPDLEDDPRFARVSTFFETKFMQPVHHTFSYQYKVTAAIAHRLSNSPIAGGDEILEGRELGAIVYPSVAHVSRTHNIAVRPDMVQECLKLRGVREIEVIGSNDDAFEFVERDFSAEFVDGEIMWKGRTAEWAMESGQPLNFTIENKAWVARDRHGMVVHEE
jgi:hypothetical protein